MALKFIHTEDYKDIIFQSELDVLTEGESDTLTSAENKAISKIKKFLLRKYDVDKLFEPVETADVGSENDNRDITLVEYAIYYTLYTLYTKISKRNVPEDRYEQYKEARDFFKDVQHDMITPGWPLKMNEEGEVDSPSVRITSGRPLSHYY